MGRRNFGHCAHVLLQFCGNATEICFDIFERVFDVAIQLFAPLYVIGASFLISMVAYTFFTGVWPHLKETQPTWWRLLHGAIALFLLVNIFFNYMWCVFTRPGSTVDYPHEKVVEDCPPGTTRYCNTCQRPKPPLAHHCHISKKCILKMDHYCPWMANCVGYYNYRYFFLFLFWMWVGCLYACSMMIPEYGPQAIPMMWDRQTRLAARARHHGRLPLHAVLSTVMPLAVLIAISCLLGWHIFLTMTGQGTIDFFANKLDKWEAESSGRAWRNIYDRGVAANWKEAFDVSGPVWWLVWMLPNPRRKKGNPLSPRSIFDDAGGSKREPPPIRNPWAEELEAHGMAVGYGNAVQRSAPVPPAPLSSEDVRNSLV